ncbi:YdcF family protein, partial [Cyanobacteria bacterium FACHB-63]|nr:YdcF family protein [Cyanobacteria bacterium FACHB-63]
METLIVLALIGSIWLIAPRRWRRFISLVEIVLLLCVLVGSPIGLELIFKAMVMSLPKDQGDPAAAIVVLGRGP